MEEVVGSIPTRSTKSLQQLRQTNACLTGVCVMVCVTTGLSGVARASIAGSLRFHAHMGYRSSILRLTCPAIVMMVESDVSLSEG